MRAFELGPVTRVILHIVHRALVAPPGMAYLLPAFVWWGLVSATLPPRASRPAVRDAAGYQRWRIERG